MKKGFNLSDKRLCVNKRTKNYHYPEEAVKQFIKEILDEIWKEAVIVKEIDLNRKIIYADLVDE
ncbi:hypothetical protein DRN69_07850, partial [Candidatus Pacearchaeota archaeon]